MRNNKNTKKSLFILLMIIFLTPIFTVTDSSQAEYPDPFFSISVLAPATSSVRPMWSVEMISQLPKIGIGVEVLDVTGWAQISPRTWNYPGPYPIPSYSEGGFDILFLGWGRRLDVDFTGIYDSASIVPNGDNFYQYNRSYMDEAIYQMTNSFDIESRIYWSKKIQEYLYEDIPSATLYYPLVLFPMDTNFDQDSWDGVLWNSARQDMSGWDIPGQTEFRYAIRFGFEDFNPYYISQYYRDHWSSQIYGGLVERTAETPYNRSYGPYACNSVNTTDGLTYQVQLNPNLKFADGTKCNASDIKYTYELLINPDFHPYDYDDYSRYLTNESVIINSEFDLTITFNESFAFQDQNLAFDILPKHIWEGILPEDHREQAKTWALNNTMDSNIMGIGPYYLEDYDETNQIIHLKRNTFFNDWTGITPNFEDIYFEFWSYKEGALAALAAGDIDMVDSDYRTQIVEVPAVTKYELVVEQALREMAFNTLHPIIGTGELCPISSPESGKNIRKAISHLIPRVDFIDYEYDGLGSPGITAFPKGAIGFDESLEMFEYSTNLALHYMKLAGYDVTEFFVGRSTNIGMGLVTIIGILTLVGGSFLIIRRSIVNGRGGK